MDRRTLLIWETGGELLLVSYDMLSMVAQFQDESLDTYKARYSIELPNGDYVCTITVLSDADTGMPDGPDLHLRLAPGDAPRWSGPAWSTL
jgi:hypothetical protein